MNNLLPIPKVMNQPEDQFRNYSLYGSAPRMSVRRLDTDGRERPVCELDNWNQWMVFTNALADGLDEVAAVHEIDV